jgi:hypothetical protein
MKSMMTMESVVVVIVDCYGNNCSNRTDLAMSILCLKYRLVAYSVTMSSLDYSSDIDMGCCLLVGDAMTCRESSLGV